MKRTSPVVLAALLLLVSVLMPVTAFAETLDQRTARLVPHLIVTRPEGDGPFPVVFMLHGCGGQRPFQDGMAEVALRAGAAVVQIDSFGPRQIGRASAIALVCTGMRLHGRERAGDLYAAMSWARTQSWADAARFGAVGWSHGAWTIMDALALRPDEIERATGLSGLSDEPLQGLAGTLLVYPYTSVASYAGRRDWRFAPHRNIAIVAERDYIVGPTRGTLERQRARGTPMEIIVFEGATHAFEDDHAEDPRVRYDPAATAREHDLLREMIAAL